MSALDWVNRERLVEDFTHLQRALGHTAKEKGFWEGEWNHGEKIALMHSELSEALEIIRKTPDALDQKCPRHSAVAIELADVVIRIMDYCAHEDIDLIRAVFAKAEYNTTRPYKHGKKF